MSTRTLRPLDRFIGEIDRAIKVLAAPTQPTRPLPAPPGGELVLADEERLESIRLMRVNHAGEIAAQALYQGQALCARDPSVADALRRAASEERDHLAWCEERLRELHGRTSLLNPLWYAGSFAIGVVAGAWGDRHSLGFIAETERQVEAHLGDHQARLPAADSRSRAILEQMKHDEVEHGRTADALGAGRLPFPVRAAMRFTAKAMTRGAYWV